MGRATRTWLLHETLLTTMHKRRFRRAVLHRRFKHVAVCALRIGR